nr:MAG: internal scaffolding protein [Microvirus sp.]
MFANRYERPETAYTEHGDRMAPVYALKADKNGVIDLVQTGEKDLYQEIQSHADSVDIRTIMQRYEQGDSTVLSRTNGQYVDITEMPTNFAEMIQKVIVAENHFTELPKEIRELYNYSVTEYIADIGSERWLGLFTDKKEDIAPVEPVKEVPVNE